MKFLMGACLCLFAAAAVNGLTDEQRKRAQENVKKCKAEVGLDAGTANKVRAGNFSDETDVQKAKCFVKCFFKETGFMNEKGELQRDVIINKLVSRHGLDRDFITHLVDRCIKEEGKDDCDKAYKIFQCYRQNRRFKERIQSYSTLSPSGTPSSSGPSTKGSYFSDSSSATSTTPKSNVNVGSSSSSTNAASSTTPSSTTKASNANPTTSSWFGSFGK